LLWRAIHVRVLAICPGRFGDVTHLRPNTPPTYTTLLDKWIIPYLGRKRLREITRETI
jgi:Phage integrase, N-terminal SAM-like domain